jgi:hypothetical protein
MRMLKLLPILMLATLTVVACGKKEAATGGTTSTTVTQPVNPVYPVYPVTDFATGCNMRGGQVYSSMCAVPVSGGYTQSSGITFSVNYYWSVSASLGLIVQGSGSATVQVGGTSVGLNSRTGGNSGTLRIGTSGNHSLQVWLVQCLGSNFAQVSCPASF